MAHVGASVVIPLNRRTTRSRGCWSHRVCDLVDDSGAAVQPFDKNPHGIWEVDSNLTEAPLVIARYPVAPETSLSGT